MELGTCSAPSNPAHTSMDEVPHQGACHRPVLTDLQLLSDVVLGSLPLLLDLDEGWGHLGGSVDVVMCRSGLGKASSRFGLGTTTQRNRMGNKLST